MMATLNPYLHFAGNCREAMEFYKDSLGGELRIQVVGDSPAAQHMPPETHTSVMHAELRLGHFTLMASDMFDATELADKSDISLCLICESNAETHDLFSKLAREGKVTHELKEEFFGTFGDLIDRYGNRWMFQFSPEMPARQL
jgi:PhnB protein